MRTNAMLVVLLAGVSCYRVPPQPMQPAPQAAVEQPAAKTAELERGKYVATVAGCAVCHTPMAANGQPDMSRRFAGGLEEALPGGGTWRAPNITPDPTTGIGRWTDLQIIAAMRRGVRPDGARLLPIMPYPYYHRMTEADARAVVAYLRTVPPVANQVARTDAAGTTMKSLELAEPIGTVDSPAMHGEYLANLMHCAACHTPQTGAAANEPFAGGTPFPTHDGITLIAPNLTSDKATGLGDWSEADIIRAVRAMTLPDGSKIRGPMAGYATAWSELTDSDARALAAYIKSLPAVTHDVDTEAQQPEPPQGTH